MADRQKWQCFVKNVKKKPAQVELYRLQTKKITYIKDTTQKGVLSI